ncbi:MAG TPA: hypothetical protein VJ397_06100, partial [Thermoplasmata archaeon]|nr:hypothetical protein [Thermoplasmata archaeon]
PAVTAPAAPAPATPAISAPAVTAVAVSPAASLTFISTPTPVAPVQPPTSPGVPAATRPDASGPGSTATAAAGPEAEELTLEQVRAEIRRNEQAIATVEDMYLSGELDIAMYADIKKTKMATIEELRGREARLTAPAVPAEAELEPPAEVPEPEEIPEAAAPEEEAKPPVDFTPSTKPIEEMTMEEISEEIARNQEAVAAVEDMYMSGAIDRDIFEDVKRARRDRNMELSSRYQELRFDQLTSEPPAKAPEAEKTTRDTAPALPEAGPKEEMPAAAPPEERPKERRRKRKAAVAPTETPPGNH